MTAVITCNFCHVPLELGYGNPPIETIYFTIEGNGGVEYQFSIEPNLKACFNTTNVHWCKACILKALSNQLR